MFDLAIVGNSASGLISAYKISSQYPDARIAIVGQESKPGSATLAAGAMFAVYGELESPNFGARFVDDLFFDLSLKARKFWEKLIAELDEGGCIKTANDTLVYLKNGASEFETENYNYAKTVSNEHGVLDPGVQRLSDVISLPEGILDTDAFLIKEEFGFSPRRLISLIEAKLRVRANVFFIPNAAERIQGTEGAIEVRVPGGVILARRVVVAAGAFSGEIVDSHIIGQPMLQAVGSAFMISRPEAVSTWGGGAKHLLPVIRSVNRGGSHCGLHVVPSECGGFYVGAGSYVTRPGIANHRIDTLRYLTNQLERELLGVDALYSSTGTPLIGYRPRSLDGLPLIGAPAIDKRFYVATGGGRLGLTLSPLLAEDISRWFNAPSEWEELIPAALAPDRKPISFGPMEQALAYFAGSRLSNALEHGLKVQDKEEYKQRFVDWALKIHPKICENLGLGTDFVVHPDAWGPLSNE